MLYDHLGNYTVAFLAAGCPPIIGALLMCFIYLTNSSTPTSDAETGNETDINEAEEAEGKTLLSSNGNEATLTTAVTATTFVNTDDDVEIVTTENQVREGAIKAASKTVFSSH